MSFGINGLEMDDANGACPTQAFGRYLGFNCYFRYRWGVAEFSVSTGGTERPHTVSEKIGDHLDGYIDNDGMGESLTRLVPLMAERIREWAYDEYSSQKES